MKNMHDYGPKSAVKRVKRDIMPVGDSGPSNVTRVTRDIYPTQPKPSPSPVTRVKRDIVPIAG